MKYVTRKILGTVATVAIGYLIAQYLSGVWTDTYMLALFACIAILALLAFGRMIRRLIYFPINLIRKLVLFR